MEIFLNRGDYFVKQGAMASLFPAGMASFLENDINGPDTKPKKPTKLKKPTKPSEPDELLPTLPDDNLSPEAAELTRQKRKVREETYKYQCQIYDRQCHSYELECRIYELKCQNYKLKCQRWPAEYLDRIEQALRGKAHLYSKEDPRILLAVAQDQSELWFEWGADKCGFDSAAKFEEFCAVAGVDPVQAFHRMEFNYSHRAPNVEALSKGMVWVSHDRKVTFTAYRDPRRGGYCHYFGCTGIRPRSKFLFEWFKENGSYAGYCWNGRSFV